MRFLYLSALCFGLSAGNHATVAFYLPAILLLFFAWEKKHKLKNLSLTVVVFLVGFSVYLYLPIRSLAEPIIDWGNPETLQNFFDQVTDRRHAELHFTELRGTSAQGESSLIQSMGSQLLSGISQAGLVFFNLITDLARQFTGVMVVGFAGGAFLCFRKNRPLFWFLSLITAVNASFFVGWGEESYFPSYIVACLWATLFLYWLVCEKLHSPDTVVGVPGSPKSLDLKKTARFSVYTILTACTLWLMILNYMRADRSNTYFAEALSKKELLSLDDDSVLVSEISWFNMAYHLDVMRLRDDVKLIKAADFLEADPTSYLTPKRYPQLELPDPDKHRFDSREVAFKYMMEFFSSNAVFRPVVIEQNWILFKEFPLAKELLPHDNLLLRFPPVENSPYSRKHSLAGFEEFKGWLEEELKKPGFLRETKWISKIIFYIESFANHFHATKRYKEERAVLKLMHEFLGHAGAAWYFRVVDNLILDRKLKEGREKWIVMAEKFSDHPETYLAEGLLLKEERHYEAAISAFDRAMEAGPDAFRPYMEKSLAWLDLGNKEKAALTLKTARKKIKTLKDFKRLGTVEQLLEVTR